MTTTNVPSDKFEDLKRDVEDATRYSNSTAPYTNRVGQQIRPIPLQAQDIADNIAASQQALANSGFIPKGDFTTGGTVDAKNEVFSDGSNYWRYDGALPFTVTAGSSPTPTGVGAWINVTDGTLRSQLAAVDSTVLVGGVEANTIVKTFNNVVDMKAADLSVGQSVRTLGYSTAGDEGGANYLIMPSATATADGGVYIDLANGNQARLLETSVRAEQVGITPDYNVELQLGTDYTATIQALNDNNIKLSFEGYIKADSLTSHDPSLFLSKEGFHEGARLPSLQPEPQSYELELPSPYFDWFNYKAFYNQDGTGYCDIRKEDVKPTGTKKYYVGFEGASDSNDGLTMSTSLATITAAYAKADVDIISLAPKRHFRPVAFYSLTLNRDVQIICEYGRAELVSADDLTWTVNATFSNVYEATRSSLQDIIPCWDSSFVDENGDYLEMQEVSSIADVSSTPNSWFTDGSTVYVRTLDDRVADSDILVLITVNTTTEGNGFTVYFENIDFVCSNNIHRSDPATGDGSPNTVAAVNCTFKYSSSLSGIAGGSGGFRTEGVNSYLFDCVAAKNAVDGFNYHSYNSNPPRAFEFNCVGRDNGHPTIADNASQGTTMHQAGSIIRINGEYYSNKGPSMADVGAGCSSFNVGSYFYNSESTINARSMDFFASSLPETDYMRGWLIGVKSTGGIFDLNIPSKSNGFPQCIIRSFKSQISRNSGDGSGIVQYYPFLS